MYVTRGSEFIRVIILISYDKQSLPLSSGSILQNVVDRY